MGGAKKKSISQMAKQQEKEEAEKKEEKRERKTLKSGKETFDKNELEKALRELKVITPNSLASQLNIRVGVAKRILASLERKGQVKLIAGSSRLRIYSPS
ncbi:MAG: 30S ribosomal protein S25e [Thermoproteota archaeon]